MIEFKKIYFKHELKNLCSCKTIIEDKLGMNTEEYEYVYVKCDNCKYNACFIVQGNYRLASIKVSYGGTNIYLYSQGHCVEIDDDIRFRFSDVTLAKNPINLKTIYDSVGKILPLL